MSETLRYVFWILLSLPILALGIYFVYNLLNSIHVRAQADLQIQKEKEKDQQRRKEFEESYRRRRGGGN